MSALPENLQEAVSYIRGSYNNVIKTGMVLGSGLGNFISEMTIEKEIGYTEIPHFPVSTVEGHSGRLIFGEIAGRKIVVMSGRIHFYEGYTAAEVAFPVRVMKLLGVQTLLLSNAAGGVNASFEVGDLMIIKDHISFATVNPLIGKNIDALGTRFPDMSEPYSRALIEKGRLIAGRLNIPVKEGVYFGVTGPTFETRAEYTMIRALGGDAVGMSTVQEVIVAKHAGMNVFGISVITDIGIREDDNVISHEEVLHAAAAAEPKLTAIFKELVKAV
ncbi:MAG: purine-nucleoside phosphorylase [Sphingobacteriales bacterium]|nr:purine-nucleoside phosphorylase [Sphingobacteriales bacterium]